MSFFFFESVPNDNCFFNQEVKFRNQYRMRPEEIIKGESKRGQKIVRQKSVTNGIEAFGDQYNTWDASRNARFASIA